MEARADIYEATHSRLIHLPSSHAEVLSMSDGFSAFGRYFRLFGYTGKNVEGIWIWNSIKHWKFAWKRRVDDFFCFGMTAWGDQYAYELDSSGKILNEGVFLLDAYTMEPELLFDSFEAFWNREFLRNAIAPYDGLALECRRTMGDLGLKEGVMYEPPIQLGGIEDASKCTRMVSRSMMIVNGDITTQLDELPDSVEIRGIQPYVDESELARIKILHSGTN